MIRPMQRLVPRVSSVTQFTSRSPQALYFHQALQFQGLEPTETSKSLQKACDAKLCEWLTACGQLTIGRSSSADIVILEDSSFISRLHVLIHQRDKDGPVVLEDQSSNGTQVFRTITEAGQKVLWSDAFRLMSEHQPRDGQRFVWMPNFIGQVLPHDLSERLAALSQRESIEVMTDEGVKLKFEKAADEQIFLTSLSGKLPLVLLAPLKQETPDRPSSVILQPQDEVVFSEETGFTVKELPSPSKSEPPVVASAPDSLQVKTLEIPVSKSQVIPLLEPVESTVKPGKISIPKQLKLIEELQLPYGYKMYSNKGDHTQCTPEEMLLKAIQSKSGALGDLHAASAKLLESLIVLGYMTMPLKKLRELMDTMNAFNQQLEGVLYGKEDAIKEATRLLKHMQPLIATMQWVGGNRLFILLGDVLADRGACDLMTFMMLEQLDAQAPGQIIRLASNHDHTTLSSVVNRRMTYLLGPGQQLSQSTAFLLTPEENRNALWQKYRDYLEHSDLFRYHPDTGVVYVHAPILPEHRKTIVRWLARKGVTVPTGVPKTRTEIEQVVTLANTQYHQHIKSAAENGSASSATEVMLYGNGRNEFLWVRGGYQSEDDLPFEPGEAFQFLVHGHDGRKPKTGPYISEVLSPSIARVACLDQSIRKGFKKNQMGAKSFVEDELNPVFLEF